MTARVEIDEINGPGSGITTHGVVNLNVGSLDSPNLQISAATSIRAGSNAYTKYHRVHFTSLVTPTASVSNIKIWISQGPLKEFETIQTNLIPFGNTNYTAVTYEPPSTQAYQGYTIPPVGAEPPGRNLGINGSLAGTITAPTGGYSDLWKWQVQTSNRTPKGPLNAKTFSFFWAET